MSKTYKERLAEFTDDIIDSYKLEPASIKPSGVEYTHEEAYEKCVDMVLKPPHYNQGGIETIDYMKAYSTKEEFMGHCRLTAIKYLSRLNAKDEPLENASKAKWYIEKLIEELSK